MAEAVFLVIAAAFAIYRMTAHSAFGIVLWSLVAHFYFFRFLGWHWVLSSLGCVKERHPFDFILISYRFHELDHDHGLYQRAKNRSEARPIIRN